jgi:EAL domain-containing protein (putative c-di-GMP-specific phosphodiesterase class I)
VLEPKEFLETAEETGLIVPLGEWVLRQACAQNKAWQDANLPPVRIAINLSPKEFHSRNLVEMVENVLEETKLAPKWLELEVPERAMNFDLTETARTMRRLSNLGVCLSVDDFGSGSSSLLQLKKLPINALKIDRCLVEELASNPDGAAVTAAIIGVAENLDLKVIASGVEASEQLEFLSAHNCQIMQGFYFSRPLPAEQLPPLLNHFDWLQPTAPGGLAH